MGFGEIAVIAVLGLLVFGPDRLPDAVRSGSAVLRQLRDLAVAARQQVADAAGVDEAETVRLVEDVRSLHPRRLAASVLNPADDAAPHQPRTDESRSTGIDPDLL